SDSNSPIVHDNLSLSKNNKLIYNSIDGSEKLLSIAAVWDYLIQFETLNSDILNNQLNLDLDFLQIINNLKGNEKCYGLGPAYPLSKINQTIVAYLNN
ncbi:uncharacterized protein ASCRUDRAFT_36130, partial [Ascoidea rubescens DSM 1968]